MNETISWDDLLADLGAYVTKVERGESFIIVRDGTPYAELGAPVRRTGITTSELTALLTEPFPPDAAA